MPWKKYLTQIKKNHSIKKNLKSQYVSMKHFNRGFTLLELIIVVAIVGILTAFAIPYYRGYIVKARLVEVEHAIAEVQSAVSTYRLENQDSWPDCPTINEIKNSLGIGLGAVLRISALSIDGATGVITATVDNTDIRVNGKRITLTPTLRDDGSFSWTWGWSEDFPVQFRSRR